MDGYVSTYTKQIDAKGRVSIPAPFRQALARDGFDGLFCYPAPDMPALDAGGNLLLRTIEGRLTDHDPYTEAHELLSTAFYGLSEVLRMDGEGRVMLSDTLKAHAGIDAAVAFVGQGYKFQIWEPARLHGYLEEARARAREVLRRTGAGRQMAGATNRSAPR